MEEKKVFRTKTGYCHIMPNEILLKREGIRGKLSKIILGDGLRRAQIIYLICSLIFIYYSPIYYIYGMRLKSVMLLALGLVLLRGVISSRNNSAIHVLGRDQIENICFRKAIPFVTRAYFIIFFTTNDGKKKKRLILLPGILSNGKKEAEKALAIMRSENLID